MPLAYLDLREIDEDSKSETESERESSTEKLRVSQRGKWRETQPSHVNAWTFCGPIFWHRGIDDTMDW